MENGHTAGQKIQEKHKSFLDLSNAVNHTGVYSKQIIFNALVSIKRN